MTSTSERRKYRAPGRKIMVGDSEIRLISASDLAIRVESHERDQDLDKGKRTFIPGGRFDPEKFPETEAFLREWRRKHS